MSKWYNIWSTEQEAILNCFILLQIFKIKSLKIINCWKDWAICSEWFKIKLKNNERRFELTRDDKTQAFNWIAVILFNDYFENGFNLH